MRIVSLLPGATEIVYALGLQDSLHGVTYACDYPPAAREKPVVVRTGIAGPDRSSSEIDREVNEALTANESIYRLDMETLTDAAPDLVLTQALCDVCAVPTAQVTEAMESMPTKPAVLSLDPHTLADLFADITAVGEAAGAEDAARKLVDSLERRRDAVAEAAGAAESRPRVACLEWLDPLIAAGHWVPEMVALAGGEDCLAKAGRPSFKTDFQTLSASSPDVVVSMPCGFDVRRGISEIRLLTDHEGWGGLPAASTHRLFVVDANAYFSRSGPRLVDGLELLAEILHPELFRGLAPMGAASRISGSVFRVS